jgi:hypothetical protein
MGRLSFTLCLVLAGLSLSACGTASDPTIAAVPTTPALEERELPPVFSNMDLLRPAYRRSCVSSDAHLFGSLPRMTDTFQEMALPAIQPSVPNRITAYRIIRPEVDEEFVRTLAKRLGLPTAVHYAETDKTYRIYLGEEPAVLWVYSDGHTVINFNKDVYKEAVNLPPDEKCIEIARAWLNTHDLYPGNVMDIRVSPVTGAVMHGYEEREFVTGTAIIFQIGLENCELYGMGANIVIGDEGEILRADINAPEFEPYSYVRLITPEDALATLEAGLRDPESLRLDSPVCLVNYIYAFNRLDKVSLQYIAMQSQDGGQAYAQPVYIVEGQGRYKDGAKWVDYIFAVDAAAR